MGSFKFSKELSKNERRKVQKALYDFHKKNQQIENSNNAIREFNSQQKYKREYIKLQKHIPGKRLIEDLRVKGLSYSESKMYFDIRRAGATYAARTPEKRARAAKWFDEYFEPFRKSKGLTAKKAQKIWERAKSQSYENMSKAELEFALELREMGSP
jgi:hypothetical protein